MSYMRYFLTFICEADGYGYNGKRPSGSCVLEARGGEGKLTCFAQNLKPETMYPVYLLFPDGTRFAGMPVGKLMAQPGGKAQARFTFLADGILNGRFRLEECKGVAVLAARAADITAVLCGYRGDPVNWKRGFYDAAAAAPSIPSYAIPPHASPGHSLPAHTIPPHASPGHSLPAHTIPPHASPGHSFPAPSLPAPSFPASSFPAPSFPAPSFPAPSFPASSFPASSFPTSSFPAPSFPASSFPAHSRFAHSMAEDAYSAQTVPVSLMEAENILETMIGDALEITPRPIDETPGPAGELPAPMPEPTAIEEASTEGIITAASGREIKPAAPPSSRRDIAAAIDELFTKKPPEHPFQKQNRSAKWVKATLDDNIPPPKNAPDLFYEDFITGACAKHGHILVGVTENAARNQLILGVPCHYDIAARPTANMLGFTQFKPTEDTRVTRGQFGYWLMFINLR